MNSLKALLITLPMTAWGLFLRAQCLAHREWWVDETNQWHNTIGPLKPFWTRCNYCELTYFPGEYVLTFPFVRAFNDNKWGTAIPHIAATVLGYYCLYLICRRYFKNTFSLSIAFLIYTFNAELIFHAFELRPYAVLATLGLAVFYCTELIFDPAAALSQAKRSWIGILFFLTMIYHAYGILILGFCALYSLLARLCHEPMGPVMRRVWKFYAVVGITGVPLWLWYGWTNVQHNISEQMKTFDFIPSPAVHPIGFLRNVVGNLLGNKLFYPLLAGPLAAWLLPHANRRQYIGFFFVLVALPIAVLLWADFSKGYWFLQRQFIWVSSLFCFYVAWGWDIAVPLALAKFRTKTA